MGEMHEDWKQGHGTFYYSEWGSRYEGQFVANKPSQKGIYYWKDGSRYEGEWKDGKQHGIGTYIYANGKKRLGRWLNGKRVEWIDGDENYLSYDTKSASASAKN